MIALVALAPLAEGWTFDLYSALIGAAMVCLLLVLLYRSRAALQRAWSKLASSVRRLVRYFQANAEDIYRERVTAHVRGLILPAHVGPLSALFVEPSLAPPPPCPQSVPETRVGPASSEPRKLHEIFGNHSRFAVLGAPGAGRTTLLAHLAAVAADPAEDSSSAEALNSQPDVRERLPLYVNLAALHCEAPESTNGLAADSPGEPPAPLLEQDRTSGELDAEGGGLSSGGARGRADARRRTPPSAVEWLLTSALASVGGNGRLIGPLRRAFMAGRAIVLVDGWDELPSDERGLAAGRLAEAMGAVAGNVWLVAAGERGYAPLVEAGLAPLRLAPWQAAQSDALAERWAASFRDAIPAAPRVLWTELRRATRAGASPMELALRAFVYLSTQEDLPRRAGALFERAADLLLSQPDSAWLLATCHATLGRLALALFRERCATLSRAEVEAAIRESVSSSDESPTRLVAMAFRALTSKRGMLRLLPQGRLQFIHSRWQAYFAARELVTLAPTDLAERLDDPRWAEVFAFYAEFGDMGPLMSAWLSRSDDLTRSRLRALARWVSVAPEGAAWREQATALLAKTLLQPQLAHPVRRALAEDLAVTGMPGVSAFLGKLLAHPNAEVRIAALRGLGRCGAEPEVTLLEPALGDADVRVCQAALDALAALNLDAAAKALAGYLAATSNDELRPAAAEALAHCGGMGRALLREAAASDNVMVRRAAVFGLAAARERLLLERVAREDTQWIVRSAAVAVLAELDAGEQEATGVPPMPEADDLAWLISWTAGRGQGVERGTGARHMLLCALREGQPAAQLAALETLALIGRPEDVPAVEPLLRETDSGLAQAAFEVMAEVSQRYDLRLAAQGAQQTLEQHSE